MSTVTTSSPVARWLDAILCNSRVTKKYTDILKQLGCESLNEVYRLDATVLIKMGIAPIDCERIMENVLILKQTQLQLQGVNSMYLGYTASEPQVIAPSTTNSKPARKPKAVKSDKPKVPDSMVANQTGVSGLQPAVTGRKGKTAGRKANNNNAADPAVNTMMQAPYSSYSATPSLNTSSGFMHHQPQANYPSSYSNSKMPPNVAGGGGGNQAYYQGGQYPQQQQQQPQSQQSNYYQNGQATSNQNWTSGSDESYAHQFNSNQHHQQQQQHSGVTLSNNNSNKNSPLEYLERLALMPEANTDQKSMLSSENVCDNNDDSSNSRVKRNLKEVNNGSSNHDSFMISSTPPKKQCSSSSSGSNSNSPINGAKSMPYNNCSMFINNGGDFVNPRYTNSLNDSSPASTCSNTSSVSSASQLSHGGNASGGSSSLNVTMNALNASSSSSSSSSSSGSNCNDNAGLVSANLIDACNFDFFDLLPELNSSAIDQAINPSILNDQPSAQSSINTTNNNVTSNNNSSSSSSSAANEFNLNADQYFNGEQNINFNTYNPF